MLNILFLLWILISQAFAQGNQTYAIVVGVPSYSNTPDLTLPEAENWCIDTADALIESIGSANVINLCTQESTTRSGIIVTANTISNKVKPGDTVLFIYYGYGLGSDFDDPRFMPSDLSATENMLENTTLSAINMVEILRQDSVKYIFLIDAQHNLGKVQLCGLGLSGPIAIDFPVDDDFLSMSHANSPYIAVSNSGAFAAELTNAFRGRADSDKDGMITPAELYSYMLVSIARNGQPPGFRGNWVQATEPILYLRPPMVTVLELIEPQVTQEPVELIVIPDRTKTVRKLGILGGSTMVAASAGCWIWAVLPHKKIVDGEYRNRAEYDVYVARRNTMLWSSRITGTIGVAGIGSTILFTRPDQIGIAVTW